MSDIYFEKLDHTAVITLNKPHTSNALCEDFINKIHETLDRIEDDAEIYTIIITGTGKTFSAGADISEMYMQTEEQIMKWSAFATNLNLRFETMEIPIIAAINGYALGGGLELALACDIRIASDNAKMGLPETSLGVICGSGGTQRLPHIVGEAIAKEMIYTAAVINAKRALDIGLINRVSSYETLLDEALSICKSIEKNGQLAVRAAKKVINISRNTGISNGCLIEREHFSALFNTEDQKIGMGGFLAKRKNIRFKNK